MTTLNDLTYFSGNEGETDALKWYRSFLSATGPLGERGMLNHFPLFMEPDSPAQMWCDDLPDGVMSNWTAVDRNFRRTWLRHGGGRVEAMERFQNHRLTDDAIFAPTSVDVATMNKVIVEWADNHAKFGDEALVQATIPNLPPFIRAFLRYNSSPPTTFKSLCTKIKEITDPILEFEQLRHQEKGDEWFAKAEKNPDYPKVVELDEVDNALIFPQIETQRVVEVSLTKARMIEIVTEAILVLRRYKPSDITTNASRMIDIGLMHYCNTLKAPGQFQSHTIPGVAGTKSNVWLGLFQISCQSQLPNELNGVTKAIRTWELFSNSGPKIQGECIYRSKHTQFIFIPDGVTYDISYQATPYYGGLAQNGDNISFPSVGVGAFKTTLYFLLSVYLAERVTTGNETYNQAAIDSANWIRTWAYDDALHLVKIFNYKINSNAVWGNNAPSPHITGLFIEGLCVLASVTGEEKWRALATDICDAAMEYQDWHDDKGIFTYVSTSGASAVDDANIFRGLLIRGLSVAYQRNPSNSELRQSIRNYVNVQFNALQDSAHSQDAYPVTWNAPSSEFYAHGQMAALDVLMAAVIVNHY